MDCITDPHLITKILSYLSIDDLVRVRHVNKYLNRICWSNELWEIKLERDFGFYEDYDDPLEMYRILCNTDRDENGANNAAINGQLSVLKWLYTLNPRESKILPSKWKFLQIINDDQIDILKWLVEKDLGYLMDGPRVSDIAAMGNHIRILDWLNTINPIFPSKFGVNEAVRMGHIEVLEWLINQSKNHPVILPGQNEANDAAGKGHLNVLELMSKLDPPIIPDFYGMTEAMSNGHIHVLEWSRSVYSPRELGTLLCDQLTAVEMFNGASQAAMKGHLDVLKFTSQLDPPFLPSQWGISRAIMNGQLDILIFLSQLNPPILPDQKSVNIAAAYGKLEVLNFLSQLDPPLLPNTTTTDFDQIIRSNTHFSDMLSIEEKQAKVIAWMVEMGIVIDGP